MKINHMKIGARLYLGFGFVLLLLTGCIALGVSNMTALNETLLTVTNENNVKLAAVEQMSKSQLRVTIAASNVVLLADAAERDKEDAKVQAARQQYGQAAEVLRTLIKKPEGKQIIVEIDAAAALTRPLTDKARRLALDSQAVEATRVLIGELAPASEKWQAALTAMRDHQMANNEAAEETAAEAYLRARSILIGLGLLAVFLAAAIAWFVTRTIVHPMREAVGIAQRVADGDLSSRIEVDGTDETAELLGALKDMNASLQDIVGRVRAGTELIATASGEVAAGSLDLSSRTEQQASSLEETASSMEELASTVKQNADNARQADVLSTTASQVAVKGGAVVAQVVATMGSIHESSKKIVDIISVIDGIAFQTNILALNAAVEAARAGEQGRGFAVVASEVRNLAQRSAAAAKEIKLLIDDSVGKVAAGSVLVSDAGATMEELVVSVKQVSDIMGEISAAGREQELGIGQINQAVVEMDAVTQQNAALVEEASAAAESLQEQARELAAVVSVFKLADKPRLSQARREHAPTLALVSRGAPARPARVERRPALSERAVANGADTGSWETF